MVLFKQSSTSSFGCSVSGRSDLTVIIPAYNEAESIADTIKSIQQQTQLPKEIIVVDDCSVDQTAEVALAAGARVVKPPHNTGSKAGAQNFALQLIHTHYVMALDADTVLAPDAIERLLAAFEQDSLAAACGFVVPRYIRTLWERGRYIEYLLAFSFYKPIQDYFKKPLISSGCFSLYDTQTLREAGGWSTRTMAEDMDLTWTFYERGYHVRFVQEAVCYPIEPCTFAFLKKQLRRWSHGFVQNIGFHWRSVIAISYLNQMIAVATWDAFLASFVYLLAFPLLALLYRNPLFLLGYIVDAPIILVPALYMGLVRKEPMKVIMSFPAFFVLRVVNCLFILEAFLSEWILQRRLTTYEKGH